MGKLSEHFELREFKCPCGCGGENPHWELIEMLEKLFDIMNAKSILISSGFRCPNHSLAIGGFADDMHTRNGAVDICVKKHDNTYYNSFTIAEYAEKVGFKGIGIIDDIYCHVDIRGIINYQNNKWFGNEKTGEEYKTFSGMGENLDKKSREIKVIIEYENHKYSGLLTEE